MLVAASAAKCLPRDLSFAVALQTKTVALLVTVFALPHLGSQRNHYPLESSLPVPGRILAPRFSVVYIALSHQPHPTLNSLLASPTPDEASPA
jgi:hypothetical protein